MVSENQDIELKKVKKDLLEAREKLKKSEEVGVALTLVLCYHVILLYHQAPAPPDGATAGPDGLRISRLEIAKVLRERNEWKEKYFSLLEQVR